jgi:hypothetical protein
MDRTAIEAWVLDLVDRVVRGERVEDSTVEAKADWPVDYGKAARQIAALANAANAEYVVWIIGLDEDSNRVVPITPTDVAEWWPQVRRFFDEIEPGFMPTPIPTAHGSVIALVFETARRPFVTKNPTGDGPLDRDIPWRDATTTRSAKRHEII